MLFGLLRRSESSGMGTEILTLAEAAKLVLETARREQWPLAHIADRNEPQRPQHWFATSMLSIVTVRGRRAAEGSLETLTKNMREGLALSDGMSALQTADGQSRFVELSVARQELARYLKWARTVQ